MATKRNTVREMSQLIDEMFTFINVQNNDWKSMTNGKKGTLFERNWESFSCI